MIVLAGVVGVLSLVGWRAWQRARVGSRARAAAGKRSALARAASGRAHLGRVVPGACGGALLAGVPGFVLGGALAAAWPTLARARARRRRAIDMDEQIPEVLRAIAAGVRAGRSLPQALEAAREEAVAPASEALEAALARLAVGASVEDAIETFAREAGTPLAEVAAETLRVGRTAGGNFPAVLDVAVASSSERLRIARDRRAATAQARMSAGTVALMPVAFYGLVGAGARERLFALLREPVGWVILGAGLGLQAAGVLWMRAMTSR